MGRRPGRKETYAGRRSIGSYRLSGLNDAGLTLMFEPIAFTGNGQNAGVVQQAVEQRCRQRGIVGKGSVHCPKGRLLVTISEPRS